MQPGKSSNANPRLKDQKSSKHFFCLVLKTSLVSNFNFWGEIVYVQIGKSELYFKYQM